MFASLIGSPRRKVVPEREFAGKARVMCPAPGLSLWSRSSYRKSEGKWKKLCAGRPEQSGLGESAFKNKPKSRRSTEVSQQTFFFFFFLAGRHLLFPKLKAWRQYLIPRSCLQPVSLEAICSQPWGRCCMWDTGGEALL